VKGVIVPLELEACTQTGIDVRKAFLKGPKGVYQAESGSSGVVSTALSLFLTFQLGHPSS